MPLGIDKSDFLQEKNKKLERDLRTKDERIVALETENAMLYLKLAQMRSSLQCSREEVSGLQSQYDSETKFRQNVIESALKFKQELESIKRKLAALQRVAVDLPIQFQNDIKHANSVVQRHRHLFVSQTSSLSTMQEQLSQLQGSLQDITEQHAKEKKRRQELHNVLMELRGNIRVHCRVRPLMDFDCGGEDTKMLGSSGTKSEVVVHYMDDENVCVRTTKHNKVFEYERVYSPDESQEFVFDEVQPMMTSLLDGYNICIMAYGQTGSGKTHTMLGSHKNEDYHLRMEPHKDEGVIPRAARELFRLISEKPEGTISVEVSVVEIYNNDIRDLLSGDPSAKHDVITGADGSLSIPTLTSSPRTIELRKQLVQKKVDKIQDVMSFVQYGLRMRRESATMVHEHSSRSHLVVTLTVNSQAPNFLSKPATPSPAPDDYPGSLIPYAVRAALLANIALGTPVIMGRPSTAPAGGRDRRGRSLSLMTTASFESPPQSPIVPSTPAVIRTKLQLVDLAGSECVGMSGVTGVALREASNINKSLSALADVLGALAEHRPHVPYRNSRLTHFLQDSIGGDAKLLVLLCVAPAQRYITETTQCLGFGQRARQVQRGPTKRRLPSSAEKVGGFGKASFR
ncbi:kinesin-like protein KIF25 isoform X2 [Dreissena polymorpha]|uniref:kinesin-like protein KIF25 isoform X2 n=1 Tax=Dreissena polymorpha TaxID=45954 RepID=UPI002264A35A|nr:kinesin-like protein KIF25 isoform X2 [Dreissena polymorpha]